VDGVHCRIFEPKHPTFSKNPEYYSHKHKQAALCYEVALAVYNSCLVWISGPHKASKHDITIFREGLKHLIPDGKRAIGDTSYKGEPTAVSTPNRAHDPPDVKKFKG
jgi:hypothetical protein